MPLPDHVGPIERRLLREQVYATLRDWIIQGVLRPNEQLRDHELARRLQVSRTPVREALRRLQDEGLVQAAAQRWTRVAPLDPQEAHRLYPIIWSLEGLAASLASPGMEAAAVDAMRGLNRRLAESLARGDAVAASAADHDFHRVFVAQAGNPELSDILAGLKVKLRRLETAYFGNSLAGERSVAEHEDIIAAFARRDAEAAAAAVITNWQNSLERIAAQLKARNGDGAVPAAPAPGAEPCARPAGDP
ncbi:MAG TPA: GntR family transcriptional regulator [Bacillota bacterium]